MAQRRSLTQGIKEVEQADPAEVEAFVFGKPKPPKQSPAKQAEPAAKPGEGKGHAPSPLGRTPLTIRFRSHFAVALKRASLERQLKGITPNTLQDILEEAVEPWLQSNGYLN
jgi:hypothetical protein